MAKIPRIMPSGNTITAESPSAFQRETPFSGRALQTVGGAISETADMFQKAAMLAEKTKAQNDLDGKLNDINSRAEADTDTSDKRRQEYDNEIRKATEESAKLITIPQERSMFALESQSKSDITRNRVNNSFLRKKVAESKVNLDIYLDNKKNQFITAKSLPEKQMAMLERDTKINEMVGAGMLAQADATKLLDFHRKDWAKSQVQYDIETDPNLAKELLEEKQYPDIDEEDRVKLLGDAEETIAKRQAIAEKQARFTQEKIKSSASAELFEKTLTLKKIDEYVNAGMSPEDGNNLRKALLSTQSVDPLTASLNFDKFQKRFNDLNIKDDGRTNASFDDVATLKSDLLKAMAAGELEEADAKRLYREVSLSYNLKEDDFAVEEVKKQNGWFRNFTNSISFWADENAPKIAETKARLQREFLDRVSNGEDGPAVYEEVIQREKGKLSPRGVNYKVNDVINTQRGPVKVVGFDGDGEPLVEPVSKNAPKPNNPAGNK